MNYNSPYEDLVAARNLKQKLVEMLQEPYLSSSEKVVVSYTSLSVEVRLNTACISIVRRSSDDSPNWKNLLNSKDGRFTQKEINLVQEVLDELRSKKIAVKVQPFEIAELLRLKLDLD